MSDETKETSKDTCADIRQQDEPGFGESPECGHKRVSYDTDGYQCDDCGVTDETTQTVRERDLLNSENVIERVLAQCLHARKCNAPWGQTEKFPSVTALQEALNAYVAPAVTEVEKRILMYLRSNGLGHAAQEIEEGREVWATAEVTR